MTKKLWGGRFEKEIDKDFFEFQKSIQYDHKLAKYDVAHSLVHVAALGHGNILSAKEKSKLLKALNEIKTMIKSGKYKIDKNSEDIHTDIQNKIEKRLGKLALKLHTFRSRNAQIVFDEKAYCYENGSDIEKLLDSLLGSIKFLQNKYKNVSMIGYTHTQRAQKIPFKDYMGAYYAMFGRDKNRVNSFIKNINVYMSGGGLAGSPVNGKYAKAIKMFSGDTEYSIKSSINIIDEISDRDFLIEFLGILSILQMHLSRLAEDYILYSTKEFNFMRLPEEFCTGSSLMPHKKNPDFLELVRGYTGRIYGNLISILTTMKGLPLTYNRDMQLDKEPLFSSVKTIKDELGIMTKFLKGVELNLAIIEKALIDKNLYATEEAYKLVIDKKIPFKEAHDIVGKSVKREEKLGTLYA